MLAEGKKHVIVIENKILSGLNGIDKHKNLSQLSAYKEYIDKNYSDIQNKKFYLFHPDYNDIDIAQFDEPAEKLYKKISFSKIYKFMKEKNEPLKKTPKYGKYADDFIAILKLHSKNQNERLQHIAMERFFEVLT